MTEMLKDFLICCAIPMFAMTLGLLLSFSDVGIYQSIGGFIAILSLIAGVIWMWIYLGTKYGGEEK